MVPVMLEKKNKKTDFERAVENLKRAYIPPPYQVVLAPLPKDV